MKRILIVLALLTISISTAQGAKPAKVPSETVKEPEIDVAYEETTWDDLIPKDWDPAKPFRHLKLDRLKDNDPKVMEVLELMKKEWDNAPIEPRLDGKKIKIAGFVVPIEENNHAVTEFLLVPYYGACIHVPPPPANQIIHVISKKPIKNLRVMDAVWVAGEVKAARYTTETGMGMGASGYQIRSVVVAPYTEPAIISITPSR